MATKKKNIYIGLEFLRIFFSFDILLFHCINRHIYNTKLFNLIRIIVPLGLQSFFILSFYFSHNLLSSKQIIKIKGRFQRLLIPYIIWPIIFYFHKKNYKIKLLFCQILIGYGVYTVFWFSYNLIFISVLLVIIIFMTKKYISFLIVTGIFIYFYSISKYYNNLLMKFNKLVVFSNRKLPFTYLQSVIAFYLSSIKIIDRANKNKNKKYFIFFLSFILILLIIFYKTVKKYLLLSYFFAVSLIILFAILPFDKLKNGNIIKGISSYTGGIYYIHVYVNSLIKKYLLRKNIKNLLKIFSLKKLNLS
jgi:hypothetical protein